MRQFNSIQDFLRYKTNCPFCGGPLVPSIFSKTLLNPGNIEDIKIEDGSFSFIMSFLSDDVHCCVKIAGENDSITFNPLFGTTSSSEELKNSFDNLYISLQVNCNNSTKCDFTYYYTSNDLRYVEENNGPKVAPPALHFESCNIDKYWVCNNWIYEHGKTLIYSTENEKAKPIQFPGSVLDFHTLGKDKLINKILSAVIFS